MSQTHGRLYFETSTQSARRMEQAICQPHHEEPPGEEADLPIVPHSPAWKTTRRGLLEHIRRTEILLREIGSDIDLPTHYRMRPLQQANRLLRLLAREGALPGIPAGGPASRSQSILYGALAGGRQPDWTAGADVPELPAAPRKP
jgi:hypothetical protein